MYIFVYMSRIDWRNCRSQKADFWHTWVFYEYLGQVRVSDQNANSSWNYDVIVTFSKVWKFTNLLITRTPYEIETRNLHKLYVSLWYKYYGRHKSQMWWLITELLRHHDVTKFEKINKIDYFQIFRIPEATKCRVEANINREAVVVCARHVVKLPSKRSVVVLYNKAVQLIYWH